MTKIDLIKRAVKNGEIKNMYIQDVAKRFNCSVALAGETLRKLGVKSPRKKNKDFNIIKNQRKIIELLQEHKYLSIGEIGKKLKITNMCVEDSLIGMDNLAETDKGQIFIVNWN